MQVQVSSDEQVEGAWKKLSTAWHFARQGRTIAQANRVIGLTNDALLVWIDATALPADQDRGIATLAIIRANEIPQLRADIHKVTLTLMTILRTRTLTFGERVIAASILNEISTNVALVTENLAFAGHTTPALVGATTNNIQSLHRGLDPLLATVQSIVEHEQYGRASKLETSRISNLFKTSDLALENLSARTSDEAESLLLGREAWLQRQELLIKLAFCFADCLGGFLLFRFGQDLLMHAASRAKQEALEHERAAEQFARRTTEQALAATTAFRQIVMERAPLGIATIDSSGGILDSNAYLREFIEGKDTNLIGDQREPFLRFLRGKDQTWNFERHFVMNDGQIRWADITVSRIYNDGSALTLCMLRDITERKDVELRLNYEATHDGLTKLANRNLFRSELAAILGSAREKGTVFGVLFIDLDLFKYVNDTYGHAAGDFVLITAASRIRNVVNESDIVARFGGDEFAVLLNAPTDLQIAEDICQAIVISLAEPIMWGEQVVNIGSGIGLALGPADAENAEDIMRNADTAMYAAKQMGRGRYVVFDPEMQKAAHLSAQLANDLQTALQDKSQIHLLYQPIVGLEQNEILGFEALARWDHPTFGEIPREEFVKVAEKSGAIRNLGRYVLRDACMQLLALGERVPMASRLTLSVNISPSELSAPNFVESIADVLRSTDFDPRRLYLEITENIMIVSGDQANRIMSRLREFGIRISIDDFGAGYSSLRYLQELQIDILKVDRGFLGDGTKDHSGRAILRAIVNLASGFDLPVVAEGVETAEQLQLVRSIGCQYAQGELWGKPMSINEIESRLAGTRRAIN